MNKFAGLVIALVLVVVIGGGVFLASFDIPPPTAKIEKVIPDERFSR